MVFSNFPKRKNLLYVVIKMNSFVRILGEFVDTKSHFEIIWPLDEVSCLSEGKSDWNYSGIPGRQEKLLFASRQSRKKQMNAEFFWNILENSYLCEPHLPMLIFFTMLILLFRFYSYSQIKEQFFMIDFCYFLNLSTYLQTMLCPNDKVIYKGVLSLR